MKEENIVLHKGIIFRKKEIPNPRKWVDMSIEKLVFPCRYCPFRSVNPYDRSFKTPDGIRKELPICRFIEIDVGEKMLESIASICLEMNINPIGESILLTEGYLMIPTLKYISPSKAL